MTRDYLWTEVTQNGPIWTHGEHIVPIAQYAKSNRYSAL